MSYKTFRDIANSFTRGENWTHADNGHSSSECLPWQKGVRDFAEFLDKHGNVTPKLSSAIWRAIYGARPE